MEKEVVGADFYTDDYGGDYYDVYGGGGGGDYGGGGGGGIDWGFDTTSWPTLDQGNIGISDFNYGYGFDAGGGLPPDYAPGFDPSSGFMDLGGGYLYDPSTGGILATGLWQGDPYAASTFWATVSDLMAEGLTEAEAIVLAPGYAALSPTIDVGVEPAQMPAPPPPLPDLPDYPYFPLPYVDYWQSPPYIPTFPDLPPPPPPTGPGAHLPPYCPQGQYHPYPIGHPQQDICVPFPQTTTNQQQRPPGQQAPSTKPPAQQQRPQQQQQACPTGYCRHPQTGQCMPIPQGYYRHPQTQVCTAQASQVSPLPIPSEASDLWSNLKELPWWVWLALGGLLLLGKDDGSGKKTTVTYRRAR